MSDVLECDNCGAVLLEADLFCGECGAPQAASALPPGSRSSEPPTGTSPDVPPTPFAPPGSEATSPTSRLGLWQIAVIALSLLSVVLCLAGVAAFLLFALTDSDVASPQENWLYSTICCLVPIAGPGIALGLAALGIWLARVRNR